MSFGAGVQTTALMVTDHFDEIVFADTGAEWPETYEYLEKIVLPYVQEHNIKFTVVRGQETLEGKLATTLEDYCLQRRITPSRQHRWCTDRYKIKPIRKYVKAQGWELPATSVMGISYDEFHRMHTPHWHEYTFEYPLVDKRLTRQDCERIIKEHGLPVPRKSGCYYCPFQRIAMWKELYLNHPDLFGRARQLEEVSKSYPKYVLCGNGKSLAQIAGRLGEGSHSLDDFISEPCDQGYCMV